MIVETMGILWFVDVIVVFPNAAPTTIRRTDFVEVEKSQPGPQAGVLRDVLRGERCQYRAQIRSRITSRCEPFRFDCDCGFDYLRQRLVLQQVARSGGMRRFPAGGQEVSKRADAGGQELA